MLFTRFETPGLSHYSYLLACRDDRAAIVIDPRRDIDEYLAFASDKNLRIVHVLETHIHADYASGARELAERAGAPLSVSGHDEGETYQVTFPHNDLRGGDAIDVGSIRLRAVHTPGHTPEHLSFLVFDRERSEKTPALFLTGDFLFVGSVGRPDLLGDEQKRRLAGQMFRSVREQLAGLPDDLEIFPAHGAGSMCGSGMSGRPNSTLGAERISNPYLDPDLSEEAFIERLLSDVPPLPPYYLRMKKINSQGPAILGGDRTIAPFDAEEFAARISAGHQIIDLRDQAAFGAGHIPGSFGIGMGNLLAVWAAWVVPYETPLLLIASNDSEAKEAARILARVGLDDVAGYLRGGIDAWRDAGKPLDTLRQVNPRRLNEILQTDSRAMNVIDVRTEAEWKAGHIPAAQHSFGGTITDRLDELPGKSDPIATVCGGGYRATVIASVLKRHGFTNVHNVPGGMRGWRNAGLPVET